METTTTLPPLWTDALLARTIPASVPNHRAERFRGEALKLSFSALAADDQAAARALYGWLGEVEAITAPPSDDAAARLSRLLGERSARGQAHAMRAFGPATRARDEGALVAKVLHDVRGGALTSLLLELQRVEASAITPSEVTGVFLRVRDHRKIMRAALPGLDDAGRERDQSLRRHDVRLLTEKWSGARVPVERAGGAGVATVRLDQGFEGAVCESCIEFTALDRVIYNLLNNAARHARDGAVHVVLSAVPAPARTSLHVAVANRIDAVEAASLRARFGDDLGGLFSGAYTTTGSGLGLRICADMVGNAYGLDEPEDCAVGGYVGATLAGDELFGAWVHWPLARD